MVRQHITDLRIQVMISETPEPFINSSRGFQGCSGHAIPIFLLLYVLYLTRSTVIAPITLE